MPFQTKHPAPPGALIFLACLLTAGCPGALRADPAADTTNALAATGALDSLLNIQVSSASRCDQTTREAPASVTLITAQDIERYGYRTLDEVLTSVSGLYLSDDRNYSYLGVRGFGRPTDYNNRVLLLVDGNTVNEPVFGSAPVGADFAVPLSDIERIEIVRGPASALYGTGGMFAVINVVLKKGVAVDGLHLDVRRGSYHHREISGLFGGRTSSGADYQVAGLWDDAPGHDLYFPEYDSPATDHGIARNLDWVRRQGAMGSLTKGGLRLSGFYSSREKGIPTGAYEVEFNTRSQTLDRYSVAEASYSTPGYLPIRLTARGYVGSYTYQGLYPYAEPEWDRAETRWVGSETQLAWDPAPSQRLIAGAELRRNATANYRSWTPAEVIIDRSAPGTIGTLYAEDELQLAPGLSLCLGDRLDAYSWSRPSCTPRIAAILTPSSSSVIKCLYGQAYRAPNLYERFYEDPATGFKRGPVLRPEENQTLEVIGETRLGKMLYGTLSVYRYRVRNLIDTAIDPADSLTEFVNVPGVRARGLEAGMEMRGMGESQGFLNASWSDARDQQTGERLTNSPGFLARAGLAAPLFDHLLGGIRFRYEGSRKTVRDTQTGAAFLTDLNLQTRNCLRPFVLSLEVRNLFDTDFSTPGGFEHRQAAIQQEGRTLTVRIECAP